MFLGGNTGYGFYSFYEQVVNGEQAATYILKGGPGTGKSYFMRWIAERMLALGYGLEEFYCSSDSNSLDGLHIPALGVALIDGTAPHMVDPKHPGAVEFIINLGDYWDESGLRRQGSAIQAAVARKGFLFRRAYGYLHLARSLNDEIEAHMRELGALDYVGLNRAADGIIEELLGNAPSRDIPARERHLFASAITPQGIVNHLPNITSNIQRRVLLKGEPGTGRTTIVQKVYQAVRQKGYGVEVYHCALDPQRIDHVLIPVLGIAICNASEPHSCPARLSDIVIDTAHYVDSHKLNPYVDDIRRLQDMYQRALDTAIELIGRAKEAHDYLESLYVPFMDFEQVTKRQEQVLQQILTLAER